MEQINRVELRGVVGNSREQLIAGKRMCRFSLATGRAFKDATGEAKIETTWHNLSAWEGRSIPDLSVIYVGAKLEIVGRIRNTKLQAEDGSDKFYSEIQVQRLKEIPQDESLSIEM